jgi:hypothetical protein
VDRVIGSFLSAGHLGNFDFEFELRVPRFKSRHFRFEIGDPQRAFSILPDCAMAILALLAGSFSLLRFGFCLLTCLYRSDIL